VNLVRVSAGGLEELLHAANRSVNGSCGGLRRRPDVGRSHEWVGSGGSASQLVIVSQRFRQVVLEAKWRGVRFEPIELLPP
jgi:hypothetical protein